ncbi:hypothetical protein CRENBAI_018433 [Crenichthys baileyi]|uniref:Uncharacterized protein n=1 Tax=Crenichthys baileyi TaxID=28760 RepID=A0AAV9SNM0_9TELE
MSELPVTYFVFTDLPEKVPNIKLAPHRNIQVVEVEKHSRWQDISMMRMKTISEVIDTVLQHNFTYVFCFDVDQIFKARFGSEALGESVALLHAHYYKLPKNLFTYDRNPKSKACMAEGDYYYHAAIFGGTCEKGVICPGLGSMGPWLDLLRRRLLPAEPVGLLLQLPGASARWLQGGSPGTLCLRMSMVRISSVSVPGPGGQMFLIVEFINSKTVNIIPRSWFDDGTTKWPNYSSDERISRAVRKNEEPGEDWKLYDVRVLSRTASTPLSMDMSTLPSTPFHQTDFSHDREQRHFGQSCNTASMASVPHAPFSHMSSMHVHQLSRTHQADGYQEHVFTPTSRLGKTGSGSIPCSAAELQILTLLEHIKQQQMQLAVAVNSLAARIGAEMPDINLPLDTLSEVEEFEEWLQDQTNSRAKQNMVSVFGSVGGQNAKKTTWNILSRLFF